MKIGASTLPEVIISMMIAIFMFGFVSWILVSIDQREFIEKEIALFHFHLDTGDTNIQNNHTTNDPQGLRIDIYESQSQLHENLTEKTIEITNKNLKILYSFKLLQISNKNEEVQIY